MDGGWEEEGMGLVLLLPHDLGTEFFIPLLILPWWSRKVHPPCSWVGRGPGTRTPSPTSDASAGSGGLCCPVQLAIQLLLLQALSLFTILTWSRQVPASSPCS